MAVACGEVKSEKLKLPKSLDVIRFNSLSNINLFDQFNLWLNKYCLPDSNSFVRVTRCRKENAVSCESLGGYFGRSGWLGWKDGVLWWLGSSFLS